MNQPLPDSTLTSSAGTWAWLPSAPPTTLLLAELLEECGRHKKRLMAVFLVSGILGAAVSLLLPTLYRSTAVVAPVQSQQSASLAGIGSSFAGLAGIAGISLPTITGSEDSIILATLNSRAFLVQFAKRRGLVESLFARRFDREGDRWRTGILYGGAPTDDEIFEAMSSAVSVEQDDVSGLVTISGFARTAAEARNWITWMIADLNDQIRSRDIDDAERSIDYLNRQIAGTAIAELRQVFYSLIEERMKTVMLARVSQEYALRTIDPAAVPDTPARPRHALIAVLGSVIATLLYFAWMLIRFALKPYLHSATRQTSR